MKKCVQFDSDQLVSIDDYKCLLNEDEPFFGKMSIFKCEKCLIASAFPIPSNESLSEYYKKIY